MLILAPCVRRPDHRQLMYDDAVQDFVPMTVIDEPDTDMHLYIYRIASK